MNNELILKNLDATYKALSVSDIGDSILQPVKFDAFVRTMLRRTNVLEAARFIPMDSQQVDIDRISFGSRVVTATVASNGTVKGTETGVKPTVGTNKLQAVEIRAKMGVTDRTLRRNIEQGGLEQTLQDLFAEAAGRDVEEFGLLSRTDITDSDILHLSATDGWAELAGNKLYDVSTTATGDSGWPVNLFEELIGALPAQYLVDRADWRLYVPFSVEQAYRKYLRVRKTPLGDSATTNSQPVYFEGFRIEATAMLERSKDYNSGTGTMGDIAMLQHPDNMVWGIFHEMQIEPDRNPSTRSTDFYLTMEGDVHYEDANAAVVAYIDAPDPSAT